MVHTGYVCVAIIHWTLTWTTGSLTCAQMLMYAIACWGCMDTKREPSLKVVSMKKILCRTRESNMHQRLDSPMLYQLSYIPFQIPGYEIATGQACVGCPDLEPKKEWKRKKKVPQHAVYCFSCQTDYRNNMFFSHTATGMSSIQK